MLHQLSMPQAEQAAQHSPTRSEALNQPDELARQRLVRSPYPGLRNVSCELRDGQLILAGRVSSYYLKQVAQTLVINLEASWTVNNRIDVCSGDSIFPCD